MINFTSNNFIHHQSMNINQNDKSKEFSFSSSLVICNDRETKVTSSTSLFENNESFIESIQSQCKQNEEEVIKDCDASSCSSCSSCGSSSSSSTEELSSSIEELGSFPITVTSSNSMIHHHYPKMSLPVVLEEGEEDDDECSTLTSGIEGDHDEKEKVLSINIDQLTDLNKTDQNNNNNTICSHSDETCQTALLSLSFDSASVDSTDFKDCSSTSTTTKVEKLEEELNSRFNAIIALKEVVLRKNKENKRLRGKVSKKDKLNQELQKRNNDLEKQLADVKEQMRLISFNRDTKPEHFNDEDETIDRCSTKEDNHESIFDLLHRINELRKRSV